MLRKQLKSIEINVSSDDFVNAGDSLAAQTKSGFFADEEIIKEEFVDSEDEDGETEELTDIPKVTIKEAEKATEKHRNKRFL